jgi:hypothetical protein
MQATGGKGGRGKREESEDRIYNNYKSLKRLGKGENQTWTPLKKKKLNHRIYSYLSPKSH